MEMTNNNPLKSTYEELMKKYGWTFTESSVIEKIMRNAILDFMSVHHNVAIYGYGKHTEQLMLDYVGELRNVGIIIDNYFDISKGGGYKVIREDDIASEDIDGIIISVYINRKEVIDGLKERYSNIDILDFYSLFEERGLKLKGTYYGQGQAVNSYRKINELKKRIVDAADDIEKIHLMRDLIGVFCTIKDFKTALMWMEHLCSITKEELFSEMKQDIQRIYESELSAIENINEDTVLMFCIDGLRRKDLTKDSMPELYSILTSKCITFTNAYAYSTSTYESLLAAFGENSNQKTKYYENTSLKEGGCRLINRAKKQGRKIVLNTGTGHYFDEKEIEYRDRVETMTEHMWDFAVTAFDTDYLFYYSQPQCESHFPFYNPYTEEPVTDGTAILFDYLGKYGGKIRTDYNSQHEDAVKYMEDVLSPIFERLKCKFVVFADHGSLALKAGTDIMDVDQQYFTCHEDWIRIPMFIHTGTEIRREDRLWSLMEVNELIISLLEGRAYELPERTWVKIGRSEIYNPDFRAVYKRRNLEHSLLAFEGFLFDTAEKLIIFSDKKVYLYSMKDDADIGDDVRKRELLSLIQEEITI